MVRKLRQTAMALATTAMLAPAAFAHAGAHGHTHAPSDPLGAMHVEIGRIALNDLLLLASCGAVVIGAALFLRHRSKRD